MDFRFEPRKSLQTLSLISRLLYPQYHPYLFICYMYIEFTKIRKRNKKYTLKPICQKVVLEHLNHSNNFDVNNTIIIHEHNVLQSDKLLKLCSKIVHRYVSIIPSTQCPENEIFVSNNFYNNLKDFDPNELVQLIDITPKTLKFASEISVSLINGPIEIGNATIDFLVGRYFSSPKFIYSGDVIEVNIKQFGLKEFYTNIKLNGVENVYFKCNKVIFCDNIVDDGYLCMVGETAIKQSVNIQGYLPKIEKVMVKRCRPGSWKEIESCPYGLQDMLEQIEKSVKPFMKKHKKIKLHPVFLLQGECGSGKETIISSLAAKLGFHFYKINNSDLVANVYAQNETKLRNIFFNAKMASPCIISIHYFENFGKNNEGHYDERIIGNFCDEVNKLFENINHPIILFCCSNKKNLPSELQRLFLETFTINAPTDKERSDNLKWILEYENLTTRVNLDDISNKTHGFFFEDLKALIYYACRDKQKELKELKFDGVLNEDNFSAAIDYMQANYNHSLGAPKVPKVQWSDVGGLTDVKDEITRTINLPLKHPELLKTSGLKRTGILLFGPPGTGKTLIAKAVATECNLCFLSVKGPELLNMYVGQSEQNVRDVFEKARQASPCIIFFDELDSLAPNRGINGDSGGVMDRVVSQLLAEMDGLNDSATVFIIGATNRPDLIDPALLRPGRFDKLLYIGPCTDIESKKSVIAALTRKFKLANDVILEDIVKNCPINITGADFYGICANAWTAAARKLVLKIETGEIKDVESLSHENVIVSASDFESAVREVKPSISEADLRYFEKLQKELASNL